MSNTDVNLEWHSFGSKMTIIAIFVILFFIPLVGLIFSILAIAHIKNINFQLNNPLLENFRSKWLSALILRMIAGAIGIVTWFFPVEFYTLMMYGDIEALMAALMPLFICAGICFILGIIAAAIEMGAWGSLETFFRQNVNMFPAHIAREAEEGSHYLKNAALMFILIFLIIPGIIGWIFQIIGFFKLAKLERVTTTPMTTTAVQPTPTPSPTPTSANVKYCPNCGADVTGAGKFCGTCGSALT